jgi:ribonucleoside-diphosphate reductase alpha chain
VIEKHMISIGFLAPHEAPGPGADIRGTAEGARARFCPRCGDASFVRLEGCDSCLSCGYSKCG